MLRVQGKSILTFCLGTGLYMNTNYDRDVMHNRKTWRIHLSSQGWAVIIYLPRYMHYA